MRVLQPGELREQFLVCSYWWTLLRHINLKLAWDQFTEHGKHLDCFCLVLQVVPEWLWRAHLPGGLLCQKECLSITAPQCTDGRVGGAGGCISENFTCFVLFTLHSHRLH